MKPGAIAAFFVCGLLTTPGAKAASNSATLPPAFAVFLRNYLAHSSEVGADPTTEVAVGKIDLGAPNRDAYAVYVRGRGWCGSGGCNTLIAVRRGTTYNILAFVPATELPIVALPSFHGGGRDIAVTINGALDGDHFDPPTRAVLSLTGARYTFKRPIAETAPTGSGRVVIPADATPISLYGAGSP